MSGPDESGGDDLEGLVDVVLVGAGIMSATLAVLLEQLQPDLRIVVLEQQDEPAQESSNAWNNAGTGHAAYMELNYTPELEDGSIDISKALEVNTQFELSLQFWAHLVRIGAIADPKSFIHPVPHIAFAHDDQIAFLAKRHATMAAHHCFRGMEFSDDRAQIQEWIPLVMEGRDPDQEVAVTRMVTGSDVDFGALTLALFEHARAVGGCTVRCSTEVTDVRRDGKAWVLSVRDPLFDERREVRAKFVFIGAGGGTLPLLQKAEIPEVEGHAGFPVSGIWLRCDNEQLAARHDAKVYGKAEHGAPPMSVPHLDRRIIGGTSALLFGPYAGTSPKFLKHGSAWALFESIQLDNIGPMITCGVDNLALVKYLAGQVVQSDEDRFDALRKYYPNADPEDWQEQVAGQRVQIIEWASKDDHHGVLKFGTELIQSPDASLIGLLGASPGASTAVWIALEVLQRCFPEQVRGAWATRLVAAIPSFGRSLLDDADHCRRVRADSAAVLGLANIE
jgi:malate dehydrogenase (quinone)